jgi:hypothetical protein
LKLLDAIFEFNLLNDFGQTVWFRDLPPFINKPELINWSEIPRPPLIEKEELFGPTGYSINCFRGAYRPRAPNLGQLATSGLAP